MSPLQAAHRQLVPPPRCDLCASPGADQTFAHHGIKYQIDLCMFHAQVLDWVLEPFKQNAREIPDYQP